MRRSIKNIIISGFNNQPIATDIFYTDDLYVRPVVIYAHGFNGFKDWGNFDLIAQQITDAGFVCIKFNFSHNGTSVEQPEDFVRLDLFGENNYTKQLFDLKQVIDFVMQKENAEKYHIERERIYLIGHSMGGGIAIVSAKENREIKKLVTWASIKEMKTPWTNWSAEKLNEWKANGVAYYLNGRTKQQMPLNYQLYEDWKNNSTRLDIRNAVKQLTIPVLICHGSNDEAVPVSAAHDLHALNTNTELFITESDHVFGRKHPSSDDHLPESMQEVLNRTIEFLQR